MTEPKEFTRDGAVGLLTIACFFVLAGLGITIAHLIWSTPLLFALFMIAGQGLFATAMVIYLFAIFTDLRRRKVL